jgi:hypothetical protein
MMNKKKTAGHAVGNKEEDAGANREEAEADPNTDNLDSKSELESKAPKKATGSLTLAPGIEPSNADHGKANQKTTGLALAPKIDPDADLGKARKEPT